MKINMANKKNVATKKAEKKNVLIIGSRGMLGQELVRTFRGDKAYTVIAWDNEEIDIAKKRDVLSKISKVKPDFILNAAAYNAVDKAEESKKEFEIAKKINGLAPGFLAEAARKNDAILVHYSTDYVFNGQPEIPEPTGCQHICSSCNLHDSFQPAIGFDEFAKPKPISNYGKTKLLGEKEVKKNSKKYYIIRLSKLFGKPAKGASAKRSFFDVMLEVGKKAAKTKNGEVRVVDEETSCFTYAPDLAQKTKEILEAEKPFGIYHVVNNDPCTWFEAVLELYKQAKIKVKVIPVSAADFPRPAARPYFSVLLDTKLNPLRSYKDALKEYLKKK
jgi:dTDP-4-dehydrorhamnose reductase